jgi:uncharacterized membrane protein
VSTKAQVQSRLDFVDALRGLAVIFMIPLHTSHGWIRPELRTGNAWSAIQFFGGLAAPLFLSLAGVSLGLRWAGAEARGEAPRHASDLARALQLVVLGYAMRLQMWMIDGAGYARPDTYLAQLLLLAGYGLAYVSCGLSTTDRRRAAIGGMLAVCLVAVGWLDVSRVAPARLFGLMRVDVLQCIGASLAIVTAIGAARGRRFAGVGLYLLLGAGVPFIAAWTRSWVPGPLPQGLAAYLGQWTPNVGRSVLGMFPVLPWLAYTLVGTAVGLIWARSAREQRLELVVVIGTALGALLALTSSEALPHVFHALARMPWLTQPVRVAYRVGLVLVLAGIALGLTRARLPLRAALDVLGRASLLVYWVHLEFAFGAAAAPFVKKLGYGPWALGSALLVFAMLVVAQLRVSAPGWSFFRPRATRSAPLEGR